MGFQSSHLKLERVSRGGNSDSTVSEFIHHLALPSQGATRDGSFFSD
jgi:hypothetical protein